MSLWQLCLLSSYKFVFFFFSGIRKCPYGSFVCYHPISLSFFFQVFVSVLMTALFVIILVNTYLISPAFQTRFGK